MRTISLAWRFGQPPSATEKVMNIIRKALVSDQARKSIESDVLAWLVIGAIFGSVMLALWGMLLWQGLLA
jgi:hypothetical protein